MLEREGARRGLQTPLSQRGHDVGFETVRNWTGMFPGEELAAQRSEAFRIDHVSPDMGRSSSAQLLTHCRESPIDVVVNGFCVRPADNFRDGLGGHVLHHIQFDGHTLLGSERAQRFF